MRLAAGRALLHTSDPDHTLYRQRFSYAVLLAVTSAIGRAARLVHATPGQCVVLVEAGERPAADRMTRYRNWLAEVGIATTERRGDAECGLGEDEWPRFRAAWLDVQRDDGPKPVLRTGFRAPAASPLTPLRNAVLADRTPQAGAVRSALGEILADWLPAGLPPSFEHAPPRLMNGLAVARMDVAGFRDGLLGTCTSGADLLMRGERFRRWFRVQVPRVVSSWNHGRPFADRVTVLLAASDDVVLAGPRPGLERVCEELTRAWREVGVGTLHSGIGGPLPGGVLADLSRSALAALGTDGPGPTPPPVPRRGSAAPPPDTDRSAPR
ncbi:MAG: hypothetical protein AUG49_00885 [Catenulispora sp. 13_1_20CM_3_70_7]|jgi:hypothetical protein|nr:MAG: hypothetical protein AUG49_00885 [Catenulispora sp. 13_1_20CM_3_70_7]